MDKIKDEEERLWYAEKALENLWSRTILEHQIATNLYNRISKIWMSFYLSLTSQLSIFLFTTTNFLLLIQNFSFLLQQR